MINVASVMWLLWAFSISDNGLLTSGWYTVETPASPFYSQEDCETYIKNIQPYIISDIIDQKCLPVPEQPEGAIAKWK